MFVLLYKVMLLNIKDLNSSLSSAFSSLLQEFKDAFLDDGPSVLPPFRGIKHQIDFNPRAMILNRPAYRTNLEEINELQQQVKELMVKGYV